VNAVCDKLKPDLIINAGTCGGFKAKGGAIADVYVIKESANHDRRIGIPGFSEYGVYRTATVDGSAMADALGFKQGLCSTGNSLDLAPVDMEEMLKLGAACKEMELSGIVYTAGMHGVPVLGLKAITDIVDGDKPSAEEFVQNLGKAAKAIEEATVSVLGYLEGKETLTKPL